MPGARCTRSLACSVKNTRVSHHGRTGTPGIPARNGFNGFLRALPGDRAFLSPSSGGYGFVRARSGRLASAGLDAGVEASGPHDFAKGFAGLGTRPTSFSEIGNSAVRLRAW